MRISVTLTTREVKRYNGYIFDLDGTIYLGDGLLPHVAATIQKLRERGARILFLSNNPTKDPSMYVDKLASMGIPVEVNDVLNTVVTMTSWLQRYAAGASVFVIGEAPLQRAIRKAGFTLTSIPEEIDIVVASYDRQFDYEKLQIAFDAIRLHRKARLVTTNPDAFCPFPGGRGEPDAAAVVAAIEACTGIRCEVNVGKPDRLMLEAALHAVGLPREECLMIGDRLSTDIAMAVRAGMDSALVLTGEATLADVAALPEDMHPTYVIEDLSALDRPLTTAPA